MRFDYKIIVGSILLIVVLGLVVNAGSVSVHVKPISNNIVIHQELQRDGNCTNGIDPFDSRVSFFDIIYFYSTTGAYGSRAHWNWYTGTVVDIYGQQWTSGSTTASFAWKIKPSGGKVQLNAYTYSGGPAWHYDGLDDDSVYKVSFSWPYRSYSGNGYVSSVMGSNIYILWKSTDRTSPSTASVRDGDVKVAIWLSNGTIIFKDPRNVISVSVKVNLTANEVNWTWTINMPDVAPVGTGVTALYVVIPTTVDPWHSLDMVETINGESYVVVCKIIFVSGYVVGQDDVLSIKWVTSLVG